MHINLEVVSNPLLDVVCARMRGISSHRYCNMLFTDKNVCTHFPNSNIYALTGWLLWNQYSPLRVCGFPSSRCSNWLFFDIFPSLKTTCVGTPTFQLVADVISASSIRSLSWLFDFNYNTRLGGEIDCVKRAVHAVSPHTKRQVMKD